jgi:hypothetical protein
MTLPNSVEYSIGKTNTGNPCVVVKTQQIDWEGRSTGEPSEAAITIPEIEQLVGFCLRCGDEELLKAVRRPVYKMLYGPGHPFSKD